MDELQRQIIEELKVQPSIDPKVEIRRSVDFLKDYLKKHGFFHGFVLGISGGQDSTLVGKLAQIAVDELNESQDQDKYTFIAVRLPYGAQADVSDVEDALAFIQPSKTYEINIKQAVDASAAALKAAGVEISDFTKGNEKARERMKAQYSIAATYNCVVLGTDQAAEALTGFYTKHGDGASDMVPIFRLNKRQGRQLLKELDCPEHLYMKIPTADLEDDRPMLPDEVALGVSYESIDDYLEGKQVHETAKNTIEALYRKSQHKRHLPVNVFDDFWK
ncbi:ammonia-dependent NAD(+) synthetase [Lederbergia lenta]|uniref:NH(3)-dependent NAD(+) synthetase n=1 Tax=Lederbergia lenta TaxID=1467 RepID=A0A2X4W011_LEDLE|nr:ammonia-dependent NAD(+) synthetase [Lederbergia lenta]MCM3113236.1 ammonia-dependent NAD(+) synthetase [Lederbergia lenta]MEC2325975.1 ammonia-dependent NAD(+) synthetase [Lederbergia lenta]SQI53418.1 NAD+ synthetase [Lederbergia lenta]